MAIWYYFSTDGELRSSEEAFGGLGFPQAGREVVLDNVFPRRRSMEREFSWNLCPPIIYDAVPDLLKENLQALYFVHPGLQVRLFLATFGRFLFTGRLYRKVKYVSRLEFVWEYVREKFRCQSS
ncbi:unnamed protein product [Linum trigynum]|uniref:CRAL-TRIO domain-containing protein n=1 Tax=Linum trigynum TaxID=586398 RepID=A0AAV2CI87_9ROSI